MPKSRGRKKKSNNKKIEKIYKPYEVVIQDFVKYENPFPEGIPFNERLDLLVKFGEQAKIDFEDEYKKLMEFLEEYDSLYLCSFSAYYFGRQEEGIDEEAINGFLEFPPFYLEILQCLALTTERKITAKQISDKVLDFKTNIQNLNKAQSASYFQLAKKAKNEDEIGAIILRTEMMTQTLAVRNWAYIQQMEIISFELAELINDDFTKLFSFNPKSLLEILFGLVSLTEKKLNKHHKKTLLFVKEKKYDKVFDKYENSFINVAKTTKEERNKIWNKFNKNLKTLKSVILMHSDYQLIDVYSHSIDEIYDHLEERVSKDEISEIMTELSLTFESLTEINKDHIFLNNPIHSNPFIKLENEKYFSIIAHMFTHLGVEVLEKLISNNDKIKDQYALKKGTYLENKVEELFKNSFPDAKVYSGSIWKSPDKAKVYENDLILLIEEFAIIIECKSGTVTPPAKRGAPDRLLKTMKNLVADPSEQAIRFQDFLKKNQKKHVFRTKSGEENIIDSTKIKYYVPLGITLSHLGSIGCNLKKLIDANVISQSIDQLAPSISYTDLETIFKILETQAEKVHYLSRRREFEAHINFQGDEMDLFGFYLDNGFNIGEVEYDNSTHINLTLKSKDLDPYFTGLYRGVQNKKPFLKKTDYWKKLLNKIEESSDNWLSASYILLNQPIEDQISYEKKLKELTSMVLNDECDKEHNYLIQNFGPERRKYILVGYPYKHINIATRNGVINDIVKSIEKESNVRGYLIIGYDLIRGHQPYSVIAGSFKTKFFDTLDLS